MKALRRFKHLDLNFSGEARWGMSLCFTQQKTTFSQLGLRLDHKRSHTNTHTKKRTLKTMLSRWQQTRGCLRPEECFLTHLASETEEKKNQSVCLLDLEAMRNVFYFFSLRIMSTKAAAAREISKQSPLQKGFCQITPSSGFH